MKILLYISEETNNYLVILSLATRMKPLGCMTDALGSASASFEVLQRQLGECAVMVEALQKSMDSADCSSGLPVSALMVGHVQLNYLVIIVFSFLF